jgi:fermentation-respiration switch protein FrsA (DUF1100 family)
MPRPIATLILALSALQAPAADPAAGPLAGNWQGTLEVGAVVLRLAFRVKPAEAGGLTATFDSIDQGATGLPVDAVTLEEKDGARIARFTLKKLASTFEGKLSEDASRIDGQWTKAGVAMPLVMKRTDQIAVLRRPQTPTPPYPYGATLMTIENPAGGVTLAGTLTTPAVPAPFPAVILVSGSGAQDRDETIFAHKPFRVLADYLTRRGIAVLRVDDRGVGGSTGKTMTSTSEDFTGDVLAEVAALKARRDIDPRRIGLIGHSEGGLIAPLVASRSDDVAFIVLMAGTGLPGEEVLAQQGQLIIRAMGGGDEALKTQRDTQRRIFEIVKAEPDPEAAATKIRALLKEAGATDAAAETQVQFGASPWLRFFLTYDPRPALGKVRCPVLALCGEKDLQVAPRENLDAIVGALRTGGNTRFEVVVLPGLNHLFQTCKTGLVSEYGTIEETLAPTALERIGNWVVEQAQAPGPKERR